MEKKDVYFEKKILVSTILNVFFFCLYNVEFCFAFKFRLVYICCFCPGPRILERVPDYNNVCNITAAAAAETRREYEIFFFF